MNHESFSGTLGLFLDFSKAFDIVNHDILLTKLEYLGIRGIPLEWFKSYLADRRQYVIYNDIKSSCKTITCGVPQGSILGPLLFLLYKNDLANVSDVIFSLFFADDSNMFLSGKNPDDLIKLMNTEITKVIEWLRINKLSLNLKKNTFYGVQKKSSKKRTERGCDHWQCENWLCHPNQVPGSHTQSASYFWITYMCNTPKERLQGALVFCTKQKSISKKAQWKHFIMLLYIHISPIVLQSGATLSTQSSSLWFKILITVRRELRQQHPSDLLTGAGTSRERSSRDVPAGQQITSVINPLYHNRMCSPYSLLMCLYEAMLTWPGIPWLNYGLCAFSHLLALLVYVFVVWQ